VGQFHLAKADNHLSAPLSRCLNFACGVAEDALIEKRVTTRLAVQPTLSSDANMNVEGAGCPIVSCCFPAAQKIEKAIENDSAASAERVAVDRRASA